METTLTLEELQDLLDLLTDNVYVWNSADGYMDCIHCGKHNLRVFRREDQKNYIHNEDCPWVKQTQLLKDKIEGVKKFEDMHKEKK